MPDDWSAATRAPKDVDARWTKKHDKSFYDDKPHANTDRRWGFIRQHLVTAAHVHDSQHFESILDPSNTRRPILADSAYADHAPETDLKHQGYPADIQHKSHASKPANACARLA